MRILGMTKKWDKLKKPQFIDFRLQRRDKDWWVGEEVQVVYKPRSKQREVLGVAKIVKKQLRHLPNTVPIGKMVGNKEAIEDGFSGNYDMRRWFIKTHGDRALNEPLNKLTVEWIGSH